jgi:hypothetical protein
MVTVWLVAEAKGLINEMHYWNPEDWCLVYLSIILAIIWFLAKGDEK